MNSPNGMRQIEPANAFDLNVTFKTLLESHLLFPLLKASSRPMSVRKFSSLLSSAWAVFVEWSRGASVEEEAAKTNIVNRVLIRFGRRRRENRAPRQWNKPEIKYYSNCCFSFAFSTELLTLKSNQSNFFLLFSFHSLLSSSQDESDCFYWFDTSSLLFFVFVVVPSPPHRTAEAKKPSLLWQFKVATKTNMARWNLLPQKSSRMGLKIMRRWGMSWLVLDENRKSKAENLNETNNSNEFAA